MNNERLSGEADLGHSQDTSTQSLERILKQIFTAPKEDAHYIARQIEKISKKEKIDPDLINTLIERIFERDGIPAVILATTIVESARSGALNHRLELSSELREKIRKLFDDPSRPALMHFGGMGAEIHAYFNTLFGHGNWTPEEFGLRRER